METLSLNALPKQVAAWLRAHGEEKAAAAALVQKVDGPMIAYLDHDGWSELGIKSFGKREKLLAKVDALRGMMVERLAVEIDVAQTSGELPWNNMLVPFMKKIGWEKEAPIGTPAAGGDVSMKGGKRQIGHYDALRILRAATSQEVHAAYRSRARETHPDKTRGDSAAFVAVNAAFGILSDAERRSAYTRKLEDTGSMDGVAAPDAPLASPSTLSIDVTLWHARKLHTKLLSSPSKTWHEQASKVPQETIDSLLKWMSGETAKAEKATQNAKRDVQSCEGIRKRTAKTANAANSYEVFCMFAPWEIRSYAQNLELAADRRAALVEMRESLAKRRGGKGGEPILNQADIDRGLKIEPSMKFGVRFDATIEGTKTSGPFMQPIEALSDTGGAILRKLANSFRGPGGLKRTRDILKQESAQLVKTKKGYIDMEKKLYSCLLEVRNAMPPRQIDDRDDCLDDEEVSPPRTMKVGQPATNSADGPSCARFLAESRNQASSSSQTLALPAPAPRTTKVEVIAAKVARAPVAKVEPAKVEMPVPRGTGKGAVATQGPAKRQMASESSSAPGSRVSVPLFDYSKDTLESLCTGLQIHTLCRLQMVSRKATAVLGEKFRRRLSTYVHMDDLVEVEERTQRGRKRQLPQVDKNSKLRRFLAQPNYALAFRSLDLRNAPTDVLQDRKVQQAFLTMSNLTDIVYPQSGWPDGVGHARFVALFPYNVKVEAQRPTMTPN